MAIPKVCGIETEYGIIVPGAPETNPIASSSVLVNAYLGERPTRALWDFDDESPGNDARGFTLEGAMPPEIETHLVNAVLTNGARFYVDHAHPEVSTPECRDALEIVTWDRAGEVIMRRAMAEANSFLTDGQIVVYKNNSDGKGASYGCHENYLLAREVPFGRLVTQITPHFVTRQLICGAGKVGCEQPGIASRDVPFQLSQRADFFEEEVGLETTLKRPIINTRDEPHCDATKYRRLHVIVGDANMAEYSTLVKVGSTALLLAMIEDDMCGSDLALADPVRDIRRVSHDPTLSVRLLLKDGRRFTALDVQWELYRRARAYEQSHGLEPVGEAAGTAALETWETILTALEAGRRDDISHLVDWVAKERLVNGYRERHHLKPTDARLRAIDLQYHDIRPEKSLALRAGLATLADPDEVVRAVSQPPESTRAYFRGRCLARFADSIVAANWDSLVFDTGADALRRVPMLEPLRGTAAHVGRLIDESTSASDLLRRLGAEEKA